MEKSAKMMQIFYENSCFMVKLFVHFLEENILVKRYSKFYYENRDRDLYTLIRNLTASSKENIARLDNHVAEPKIHVTESNEF